MGEGGEGAQSYGFGFIGLRDQQGGPQQPTLPLCHPLYRTTEASMLPHFSQHPLVHLPQAVLGEPGFMDENEVEWDLWLNVTFLWQSLES